MDLRIHDEELTSTIRLITLDGFLDASTFEAFEIAVEKHFTEGCYRIVCDLSQVGAISSSGCGILIRLNMTASEHNGGLVMLTPSAPVRTVIGRLEMLSNFKIITSPEEAIKHFNP